jgi:DNA-binding CsgD family transcriptional regulator
MTRSGDPSLSPVYREALRLEAAGETDEAIAAALDITVEAVPALLLLAERKRARAESDGES